MCVHVYVLFVFLSCHPSFSSHLIVSKTGLSELDRTISRRMCGEDTLLAAPPAFIFLILIVEDSGFGSKTYRS